MSKDNSNIASCFIDCEGRSLAMRHQPGEGPALIWLGGFKSDMGSSKAMALAEWGRSAGRATILFDYSGHGLSSGRFEHGTISDWLADSLAIISRFGGEAPILVGSSMGGWISLLAARYLREKALPQAPSSLILIAPAVDFTERLMWDQFSAEIREEIEIKGVWHRASAYSPEPTPVTKALIEDGRKHLLLGEAFHIGCKIHILQGMQDPDVPYQHALRLVEHLAEDNVTLTLIRDGDHRLSREEDIARLLQIVATI